MDLLILDEQTPTSKGELIGLCFAILGRGWPWGVSWDASEGDRHGAETAPFDFSDI